MKRIFPLIFLSFFFIFLLVVPSVALEASKKGLLLWFDALLPTLLPFLIISQLLLKTPLVDYFQKLSGSAFQRLFHCSENGAFCLLCGFLCGYPVGARLISLRLKEGNLSLPEGQYLLSFCNNVSPMFCISFGMMQTLGKTNIFPYLFFIYGSALLFGILTRPNFCNDSFEKHKKQTSSTENIFQLIDVCIIDSFLIMIKLCGYLILFTIISGGLIQFMPSKMIFLTPVLTAFLEITGGLSNIQQLSDGFYKTMLCIAALTFGGLCCIFQTNSVISDTELSLRKYIFHKILITLIALFLFFLWNFFVNRFSIERWSQFLTVFSNHFIISI